MASDTFVRIENQGGVLVAVFQQATKTGVREARLTAAELQTRLEHFRHLQPRHIGFDYRTDISETHRAIAAIGEASNAPAAQTPAPVGTLGLAPDALRQTG